MKMADRELVQLQEVVKQKEAELVRTLRKRDGIAIEKSADQMDEIQYATERDLAIRNVDRDSALLRQVKAALLRFHDGSFGSCIECESSISPKRLAAVPWAQRCIQRQDAADRDGNGGNGISQSAPRQRRLMTASDRPLAHTMKGGVNEAIRHNSDFLDGPADDGGQTQFLARGQNHR